MKKYQNKKSIAILLAAYNAEKYIDEQIQSLIVQTNQDWTLYMRDDNSTDGTLNIMKMYASTYHNMLVIEDNEGNLGCSGNFFRLLAVVDSDYYMFCDADDVWLPDKIQESFDLIKSKELLYSNYPLLVHTDVAICDEQLREIYPSFWSAFKIEPEKFSSYNYIGANCIIGGAKSIFNREAYNHIFPIPSNKLLMFDHWIAMIVAKYGYIFAIHKPLLLYRQHSGQMCGSDKKRSLVTRLINIKGTFVHMCNDAVLLKEIGYGSVIKYFLYKLLFVLRRL